MADIHQFEFRARSQCICGASLLDSNSDVVCVLLHSEVRFVHCKSCGTYNQSPTLTPASLSEWFDSPDYQGGGGKRGIGYADYAREERQRQIEAKRRYERDFAPYLPNHSTVFEIGCASGTLLAEMRKHGHHVMGCDLSASFATAARDLHGINVSVADWLNLDIPENRLDAVLMLGTISNLQRLDDSLAAIHRRLKPGGFLFFNFPLAGSLIARLYGDRYWMFTPSVAQFMTRKGIELALRRAGLQVTACHTDRQSPGLGKIIGHARLGFLYQLADRLGLLDIALPFSTPVPGVLAMRVVKPGSPG